MALLFRKLPAKQAGGPGPVDGGARSTVQPGSPSLLGPVGTCVVCVFTLAVSLAQSFADHGQWAQAVGVIPARIWHWRLFLGIGEGQLIPTWLTLLTYVFPHGGLWHVLPNMAGLWVFGAMAEPVMGTRRFLLAYFASGAVGALGIGLVLPYSHVPAAGASLAISGLLGAYSALRASKRTRSRGRALGLVALEFFILASVITWMAVRNARLSPTLAAQSCITLSHS